MEPYELQSTHFACVFDSTAANPAKWLVDWSQKIGGTNDTGQPVTARSSISLPAIWYCVNRISGVIGQLPLELMERAGERKLARELDNDPAARAIDEMPNEAQTPLVFRSLLQTHALLYGSGRALIVRNGRKQSFELLPMPPEYTVTVAAGPEDSQGMNYYWKGLKKFHVIRWPDRQWDVFDDQDVLHIYRFSLDGLSGCGVVNYAKNAIGEGLGSQKFAAQTYKSSAVPPMVLVAPPGVFRTESDAKQFLDKWNEYHQGADKSNRVGLLREGIEAKPLAMTSQAIQAVENRKFHRQEIMLLFGIESIPGDDDSVSYNSLEQKNRAELMYTYGPWMRVWEQECERKLLSERQKESGRLYFQFNDWELLKPDASNRFAMWGAAIQNRIMSPNEVRAREGLPDYDGGDKFANPAIDKQVATGPAKSPAEKSSGENAVRMCIANMLQVEGKRVVDAAGRAGNFVTWLDKFYSQWESKLSESLVKLGGLAADACVHCEQAKKHLLEIAGVCQTTAALEAAVKAAVEHWPARAETLTQKILELEKV